MILDFFIGGCTEYMNMKFSNLHHLGTQFFLEMLTFFSDRKFASSILRGGKHSKNQFFPAVLTSHTKSSQCADVVLTSHTKSSQCADVKYLTSASECPVRDLVLCDLLCE